MKIKYATILHINFLLFLSSCGNGSQVAETNTQIQELSNKLQSLQEDVSQMKSQLYMLDFENSIEKKAYLTPGSNWYDTIKTNIGLLTVSLDDVKPYANGSKITLHFGNLQTATINGLKATIVWGKLDQEGSPISDGLKSKEVTLNESLIAGTWTRVNLVLEGVPPTELGFIRILDVGHTGINFMR